MVLAFYIVDLYYIIYLYCWLLRAQRGNVASDSCTENTRLLLLCVVKIPVIPSFVIHYIASLPGNGRAEETRFYVTSQTT